MGSIFISYRREDTSPYAGRLRDTLSHRFGADKIFRDIDGIVPGQRFPRVIEQALASCDALLALIGPEWLGAEDEHGRRRLDDPKDFVRQEIAAALAREDVVVIPVLIGATRMPDDEDLPSPLVTLTEYNALRLSDEGWDDQVARLVRVLEPLVQPSTPGAPDQPDPTPLAATPPESPARERSAEPARAPGGLARVTTRFGSLSRAAKAAIAGTALIAIVAIALVVVSSSDPDPAPKGPADALIAERTLSVTTPEQDAAFDFEVREGARVSATAVDNTFEGYFGLQITDGGGTAVTDAQTSVAPREEGLLDTTQPLRAGTYTLLLDPRDAARGSATIKVYDVVHQKGAISRDGAERVVQVSTPGQDAIFDFEVGEGGRVSVPVSRNTFEGYVDLRITDEGDDMISGAQTVVAPRGEGLLDATVPLRAGRYKLLVDPRGSLTGSATVRLHEVVHQTGAISADGPEQEVRLTTPGQNAIFDFEVSDGNRESATVVRNTFDGYVSLRVADDAGDTVLAAQTSVSPRDETGAMSVGGPDQDVRVSVPGQNAMFDFEVGEGAQINATIVRNTFDGYVGLSITDDTAKTVVAQTSAAPRDEEVLASEPLPAGRYKLVLDPRGTLTGSATVRIQQS